MIRQDGNGNQNNGRSTQRNSSRIPIVSDVLDMFGGGGQPEMQTTTQQNLPSWAIPFAQQGLNLANYYTMNPNYRPSTLDRDYSGIRGYNAQGQPNSQVGSFGLNPLSIQPSPTSVTPAPPEPSQRNPYTGKLNSQKMSQFHHGDPDGDGTFDTPLTFRPGQGFFLPDGSPYSSTVVGSGDQITQYYGDPDGDGTFDMPIERGPDGFYQSMPVSLPDNLQESTTQGRSAIRADAGGGTAIANDSAFQGGADTFNINPGAGQVNAGDNANTPGAWSAEDVRKAQAGLGKMTVADGFVPFENTTTSSGTSSGTSFDPSQITPFQAYDRQRFAAPGQNTLRGEEILAGRYDQRFGPGGTDPFAAATTAVDKAAGYGSTYKGLMDSESTLAKSGGYQTGLGTATDPNIFKSGDYTTDLKEYTNPNKDLTNVNKELLSSDYTSANTDLTATEYGNAASEIGNVNANVRSNQYGNANQGLRANQYGNVNQGLRANQYGNVNQGIQAAQYGNASQGLQGTQNYNRNYQDLVQQSFNPFQDQVVNQTIKDLDRARQITNNEISGSAAKAGAFGGSREALMRAENNRNFFDRVGSAVGQLRSQGFESAANRANQENLQRLGLTASDVQNVRGIQNQGNLQGQSLTADAERQRQALMSQGGLQGQNLTASAQQQLNSLLSQGNLQGQNLTASAQQQLNSLLSQGNLQGQNLSAASDQQANALRSQGALAAQDLQGRGALQGQNLTASAQQQLNSLLSQGNLQGQSLSASDLNNVRNLISQGGLAAQGLESQGALAALGANAGLYQSALGLNAAGDRSAMGYNAGLLGDAMRLDASDLNQRRNLASNEAQFAETANRGAGALNLQGGQALGQLAQAGTADERQRIADILAAGGAGDARNQQDLDFIFNEFNRELAYPGQQIDLRNAAISPATGSIVTTTQPRYQQNPILGGLGGALTTYGITSNPYLAGAAGLLSYLNS